MTRKSSCHLIDMLAEVPDPRNNKGRVCKVFGMNMI